MNITIFSAFVTLCCLAFASALTNQKTEEAVVLRRGIPRGKKSSSKACVKPSLFPPKEKQNQVCTRQLEQIVFSPPSNVKDYLAKIAAQIRLDIQVIMAAFAGGNLEYVRTYTVKYGILITILAPFGQPVLVADSFVAYTDFIQNVAQAQTYTGRDGYYVDVDTQYYNYQFVLMSTDNQMVTFVLSLPMASMTNTALKCL